ncbi:hypothetical protein ElyMa_002388400 [Elysia marginata]|uniref:Uncharacterized protein n=1 Tax=Elysia marginata TaxID=1093978 RepID=A0AAV4GD73_9GAST|nr:hypothetical protein ElyMa_002388400 [Elysia marginata]
MQRSWSDLSRCTPGRVIWRSRFAQVPRPLSWCCWQSPLEWQVNMVGARATAQVGEIVLLRFKIRLTGLQTTCFFQGCSPRGISLNRVRVPQPALVGGRDVKTLCRS